jgi:hypothetical protein
MMPRDPSAQVNANSLPTINRRAASASRFSANAGLNESKVTTATACRATISFFLASMGADRSERSSFDPTASLSSRGCIRDSQEMTRQALAPGLPRVKPISVLYPCGTTPASRSIKPSAPKARQRTGAGRPCARAGGRTGGRAETASAALHCLSAGHVGETLGCLARARGGAP